MSVLDQFSLKTKVALVTGGEGLLGRMICQTIRELGGTALSVDIKPTADHVLDITDGMAVNQTADAMPPVDILVNCAVGNQAPVQDAAAGFGDDLNIGLVGSLNMTAAFGSKMTAGGVILNLGSDLSFIAPDARLYPPATAKPVSYSVVKHGIVGMTRYFAAMWGGRIRVNVLCPGGIDVGQKIPHVPIGRLASLDEMRGPVAFLVSDASSYVTGAALIVDGGRTCW
jgi:NAD(P)-dependent dehydrogenase (short-subunit alcohol dehydrogenase family)